jgi:hypothetical protein
MVAFLASERGAFVTGADYISTAPECPRLDALVSLAADQVCRLADFSRSCFGRIVSNNQKLSGFHGGISPVKSASHQQIKH